MILIGQYDSPFVRRVGIALTLYDLPFEHWPWSTFGDADKIRPYNPLTRVPTFVLDDGTVLADSHIILDYLDGLVPAARRMYPVSEPARHKALRVGTLAMGMAEKTVSLFYEKRLHAETSDLWVERCRAQIGAVLSVLEAERRERKTAFWFGSEIGHADIAVAVAVRQIGEVHPGLIDLGDYPVLAAHSVQHEALPAFQAIRQAFIPPA